MSSAAQVRELHATFKLAIDQLQAAGKTSGPNAIEARRLGNKVARGAQPAPRARLPVANRRHEAFRRCRCRVILAPVFALELVLQKSCSEDGPGRDRTCDLGIKSPLLYQLSYRPRPVSVDACRGYSGPAAPID